jgi:uncharacterized protein
MNHKSMIEQVFMNYPLVSALVAVTLAQLLKFFYFLFKDKKINFRYLVLAGGMPSSHSSMVIALSTAVGIQEGWKSPLFAMAIIFASVVLYDAAGVRRAAGKQAKVLNTIMDDLADTRRIKSERLKELLGHTPMEVWAGVLLGIFVALIFAPN